MNSLQKFSEAARKALIAITIVSTLTVVAAAQRVQPQQQGKMYGEPGFVGEPINLKVVNADIRDILNYITEQYGINFVIDSSVKAVPVTVNVNDVPWNMALDSVLAANGLGVQVNGNILRVADIKILASEADIRSKQMASQLALKPLVTQYIRLNYAKAKGGTQRSQSTSGTATVAGASTVPNASSFNPETGTFASQDIKGPVGGTGGVEATGLLPIIQRRLSSRGSIEIDDRANALIITDVKENVDSVLQLIKILDQPEPQVEIEARIVVATRNFSRDVGVQLSALVIGARGSGASGGTLPGATTSLPIPPSLPVGSVNNSLASSITNTAIGLTTGVFGTAQINLLLTAGEQKGQAKIIATPKVTALNNEKAKIESKTQVPITTVQAGSAGGAVVASTTYVDVPLKLEITPQITDVGTVVLDVLAENSSTSSVVSGASAPAINNQNMSTRVVVPDGGTTVVGGVLFDDERESQDRTPGISKIPLLGNLFKRKGVSRNTNEILFFITPRIIKAEYSSTPGQSGVITSATLPQAVPLGNPPSNSEQKPTTTVVPVGPVISPEPTPKNPQ
jgi:type IV pilus assembly protein PilQ